MHAFVFELPLSHSPFNELKRKKEKKNKYKIKNGDMFS